MTVSALADSDMRLETIKLAGFKSFVDPTTLPLPGNLVGIVGPNGCGKSNVIDAVRWVMGESSAKHLRGDTMADVIFNGSASRKPVGIASVELIFDNSDGAEAGEYSSYQKIAIKRQVGRDGQSIYMLNGSRCRRKDITDLFLGTGLGARSYAIIEQGTISRLIEARPEELREIIEEAAGISRYKERRHETEIRMRHTAENLERLEDVRGELRKQVESLQRQVKKAERYLALREQERRAKGALLQLRWARLVEAQQRRKEELDRCAAALRHCVSVGRETQEALTACSNQRESRQSSMQDIQAAFYELGAEIGRLDDFIKQATRSREDTRRDLDRLAAERDRAQQELEHDLAQMETLRTERMACEQDLACAEATAEAAAEARRRAEASLREIRTESDAAEVSLMRCQGQVELLRARECQIHDQQIQHEGRLQRLQGEREELQISLQEAEMTSLQEAVECQEAQSDELRNRLAQVLETMQERQRQLQSNTQRLHGIRAELHTAQGRLTSLELLQHHAMGKDREGLVRWLSERNLHQLPRLAESLDVAAGWEAAVEQVLGLHLEALCVADADPLVADLAAAALDDSLVLFEQRPYRAQAPRMDGLQRLADLVQSPWDLNAVLSGVFCAADLAAARDACTQLSDHESVVTLKGERLGPGWIALRQPEDSKAGVLQRERELRRVRRDLEELTRVDADLAEESLEIERQLAAGEAERRLLEAEVRRLEREILDLHNQLHVLRARHEQASRRLRQVEAELEEVRMQSRKAADAQAETLAALRTAEQEVAQRQAQAQAIGLQLEEIQRGWSEAERRFDAAHEALSRTRSRCETLRSSEQLTARHLERARHHCAEAAARLDSLSARYDDQQSLEAEQNRLDALRSERQKVEQQLTEARRQLAEFDARLKAFGEARLANEREAEGWKERIEQTRIAYESDQVRLENLQEQFAELGLTPVAVEGACDEASSERHWQEEIDQVAENLARLGAVNLLAVQEHEEHKARLDELDGQCQDLSASLETLRQAIEKIDRECRALFRSTFDRINAGFQLTFPKLFGGGNASLELTERDLLDAGVTVIARPPGKRNSSIHLLSGGEKALTAVALVFAIFELNPAPFCLLDEVDAPLDDANVGRFCGLVKEMAERVQFLFITHNKVTMEIAEYLAGVTMKEPGVSRIVAVDVAAAVDLVTV